MRLIRQTAIALGVFVLAFYLATLVVAATVGGWEIA